MHTEGELINAVWSEIAWQDRPTIVATQIRVHDEAMLFKLSDGTVREIYPHMLSAQSFHNRWVRPRAGMRWDWGDAGLPP